MKKIVMILAVAGLIWALCHLALGQSSDEYKARIVIEPQHAHLQIKAFCFNNTSEDNILRYRLRAEKKGKSGRTVTSQSGSVYIPSQEERLLSQLGLKVAPEDKYQTKLEVYKDGKLVAEDSIVYSQD